MRSALRWARASQFSEEQLAAGQSVAQKLLDADRCAAASADDLVPHCCGYYTIFVDSPDSLPQQFGQLLGLRQTQLIYLGIAERSSLRKRLVEQDLRHKHPSTFFRGLGAVLGYRPPLGSLIGKKNQNNYKFSASDTSAIIGWVNEHLSVSWLAASPADRDAEGLAIQMLRPLLNTSGNQEALPELAQLREKCRRIARSREA